MLYSAAKALPPPTSLALGHLPHRTICGRGGWVLPHRRDDRKGRPYAIFQNFCNESPFRQSYGCKEVIL